MNNQLKPPIMMKPRFSLGMNAGIKVVLVSITVSMLGCSDFFSSTESEERVIQKKIDYSQENIAVNPIRFDPKPQEIDYSAKPLSADDYSEEARRERMEKQLDELEQKKVAAALLSKKQNWVVRLHDMPVGYLRSEFEFNKKISTDLLADFVAYGENEVPVLDQAFPSAYSKVTSVRDGNILTLESKVADESDIFTKNKAGVVSVRLMNTDCPELKQEGGEAAKKQLERLIDVVNNVQGDEQPKLKIRYRKTSQHDLPLVILTLEFPRYELSINRSLVYSGHCFAYRNFNQDSVLINIEDYARSHKKGLWRKQAKLMADDKWMMPWEFRKKNN